MFQCIHEYNTSLLHPLHFAEGLSTSALSIVVAVQCREYWPPELRASFYSEEGHFRGWLWLAASTRHSQRRSVSAWCAWTEPMTVHTTDPTIPDVATELCLDIAAAYIAILCGCFSGYYSTI